jgi:hypothetical protein
VRASDVDKQRRFGKLPVTMRRLASIPGITFLLFFGWKVALLVFTEQPVPSNDSFFYDGPVVNYLLHGKYCNPSLAMVMPIAGHDVFAAYPPLYQGVLLGWMKCFGTSALAAMWLHVLLLLVFAVTVLLIFRQLQVPATLVNLAGLFLFGITFHDRPDTLAQVMGALTILALVRGLTWPAAALLLLTFGTSLQIGAIYLLWAAWLMVGSTWLQKTKLPWTAVLTLVGALAALVLLVKFAHPEWWAGFLEHVRVTPSISGLRVPRMDELLKVIRTAPGIMLVVIALAWIFRSGGISRERLRGSPPLLVALSGALAALALIAGCLFVLTPNAIHIAGYLQPVIVGSFLAGAGGVLGTGFPWKLLTPALATALLVSVRALGLTTWGVACARDVGYGTARSQVNATLDAMPPSSTVFVSAAFLYDAAVRTNVTWLHSDWPAPASESNWELHALERLKPARLILTQFDYYRRYEAVLNDSQSAHTGIGIRITNLAHVPAPDASPALRKIVQHISWAPVIVEFSWPQTGETK